MLACDIFMSRYIYTHEAHKDIYYSNATRNLVNSCSSWKWPLASLFAFVVVVVSSCIPSFTLVYVGSSDGCSSGKLEH